MLSTDKQTDKLTNATKNITSFAKEVINRPVLNIYQPDSLLPQGHLAMFQRTTLKGQTGLEHELKQLF